jgi:translocation and assembly module TamB
MAKHKVAPAEDEDDEETYSQPKGRAPARSSRLGWFVSRLIVMLLLLGVLVWFLPAIASNSAVWKTGLSFAAPELKDRVAIQSLSLGWLSGIRAKGVVLQDAQGNTLAEVAELKSDNTLYQLALDSSNLGKFHVLDPKANVVLRADGSNWEDFLKLLPKSESKTESQPVAIQLELLRGSVQFDDQIAGKQWTFDGLNCEVDWPAAADKPRTAKLSAAVQAAGAQPATIPPGDMQAELSWQPTAAGLGTGQVTLRANNLALDISQGALRRCGVDVQAAGSLTTELVYQFARDAQDHTLQLRKLSAPQLAVASATYLSTDVPRLSIEAGQGQVQLANGKITVAGLDVRTNVLTLTGSGQAAIGDLATAASGGAIGGDSQLQVQGQLDLATLAAQLPATLHLKNDTRITNGRVNLMLVSRHEPAGRLWQAGLQTDNLVAESGGRQVQWDEPLTLEATARQAATGVTIDRIIGKASFFELQGNGTLAKGELTAGADLNRLVAELDQFIDFGAVKLAGNLAAKLNWQQNQGDQWQATATAQVQQFALEAPGVVPWKEDNLQLGGQVTGRVVGTTLQQITAATFNVLSSADQLEVALTKAVDQPSSTTAWPLRFALKGDLATWQPRVQAFVPLAGWRTAGGIDLQGGGTFSPALAELTATKLELNKLEVSGPGLAISEQKVVLETIGSWDQKNLTFVSSSTTLASSAIALRGDNIKAVLGGTTPTVQGVIDYRGDLTRLMTWLPAAEPRAYQLAGMLEGRVEAALRSGKVEAVWSNDIKNLTYASPDAPGAGPRNATLVANSSASPFIVRHVEPLVKVSTKATYDPATDALTVSQAQLQSSIASFNADGTVTELTKRCLADVKGQIAYDFAVLTQLMNDKLYKDALAKNTGEPPLNVPVLTGKESRAFSIRGPLLAGANGDGLVSSELTAQAEVGWQSAQYFGLTAGPGVFPAKLEQKIVYMGPLDLSINEGKLLGAPRLNLTGESPVLEMDKGQVIQNLRISPELCDGWMKFVAPLLAGVTRAEGNFSVDLDGARVPLMTPTKGTIGGVMSIHKAEVGPGPLAQKYLDMAKLVKDIADGNYAALGSLLTPGAVPPQTSSAQNRGVLVLPEQQVKFEMIDGRVHHQGLQMTVKDVVITTRGSVGLDQTMELVAEIPVQDAWVAKNAALASLKGQMLQIPIRGTLAAPVPDTRGLTNLATSLGRSAATGLLEKKVGAELNKFLPGFNPAAPAPGTNPAAPGTTPAPPVNPLDQFKNFFPR